MKIIEIATGYTQMPAKIGAATEIVIENLLKGFNNLQIENELIDISFSAQEQNLENYLSGTRIHKISIPNWLNRIKDKGIVHLLRRVIYSVKVGYFLKKYLKRQSTQESIYIHFHNQFNFFFVFIIARGIIRQRGVDLLYTIHTPSWSADKTPPRKLLLEKFAISHADTVISLTTLIRDNILKYVKNLKSGKLAVIPNGVDSADYYPLNTDKKQNQILNIGSVCERKSQLETIMALKKFLKKESFKLVFAGKIIEPQYFQRIKNYIEENNLHDHVVYKGEVEPGPELNKLYNVSKLYVSHSKQEAFVSLVILESMAAGLPVILSSSFDSFLDKDDVIRETVKIVSDEDFYHQVKRIIECESYSRQYADSQRRLINQYYTWGAIVEKMIKEISDKKIN